MATIDDDKSPIASDVLRGSAAIAKFRGEPKRRTDYLLEKGIIPAGKEGNQWVASKARLIHDYQNKTGGGQ